MKKLFDDNNQWTDDSRDLGDELYKAFMPIFEKYINLGFSFREIAHIANYTIFDTELELAIQEQINAQSRS